jgi:ABC-2 type transport system permease protein
VAETLNETLKVYGKLIGAQGRGQASYRMSFWLDLVGTTVVMGADLIAILVIFSRVRVLAGFSLEETIVLFGLTATAFSLSDLLVGNIEKLRLYIRLGTLDTVMIRPLSVLGQLLVLDVGFRRIGRILYGAVVLGVALAVAGVDWTPAKLALVIVAPLAGAAFFCGFFIATSTVAFWWIESGELANSFTYGGRDFASYPVTVYSGWFRKFFAFGLGFAFVAYYPGLILLGKPDPLGAPAWLGWLSPLVSAAVLWLSALIWRFGVRHYRSTGS